MPGAAEPAKSRAQPGSLDLSETDPAKHLQPANQRHLRWLQRQRQPDWPRRRPSIPSGLTVSLSPRRRFLPRALRVVQRRMSPTGPAYGPCSG